MTTELSSYCIFVCMIEMIEMIERNQLGNYLITLIKRYAEMKNKLTLIIATGFILSTAVMLSAQEAHQPTLQSPEQIVNARKLIMKTFVSNIGDIKKNIQSGNLQDISINERHSCNG